jgi:hypothetical protein
MKKTTQIFTADAIFSLENADIIAKQQKHTLLYNDDIFW